MTTVPTLGATTAGATTSATTSIAAPAATTTAVAPPSALRGKNVEEIVNKWSQDLETHVREFNKFASEVHVWDRALMENGNSVRVLAIIIIASSPCLIQINLLPHRFNVCTLLFLRLSGNRPISTSRLTTSSNNRGPCRDARCL